MPLASVSHRLRPRGRGRPSRVLKNGSKSRGIASARNAAAVVGHGQHALLAVAPDRHHEPALGGGHEVQRLQRVHQQVVHDLLQRHRLGLHAHRRLRARVELGSDAALRELGREQVHRAAHHLLQHQRLHVAAGLGPLDHAAQTADHIGRAAGLLHGLPHRVARGGEIGRIVVEQPARGLRVGQHGRERLVQFVRQPCRQLAQRVEPRDLSEPQQLFGPATCDALPLRHPQAGHQHRHRRRPSGDAAPRQFTPADLALRDQIEGLARRRERLGETEMPAALAHATGLQHQLLPIALQAHTHRARLRIHRPVAPRHGAGQVDFERVAEGRSAHHELVAAVREVERCEFGALLAARPGLRRGQRFRLLLIGPCLVARPPLHL
jgi:hypothetical protein